MKIDKPIYPSYKRIYRARIQNAIEKLTQAEEEVQSVTGTIADLASDLKQERGPLFDSAWQLKKDIFSLSKELANLAQQITDATLEASENLKQNQATARRPWPETIMFGEVTYIPCPDADPLSLTGGLIFDPKGPEPFIKVGPPVPNQPGFYYWDQNKPADQYGSRKKPNGRTSHDVKLHARSLLDNDCYYIPSPTQTEETS